MCPIKLFHFCHMQTAWVSSPKECNFPETIPEEASSVEEERVVIFRLPSSSFKPSIYTAVSIRYTRFHLNISRNFKFFPFSIRPTRASFNKVKNELLKPSKMNIVKKQNSILTKFIGMRNDEAKNRHRKGIRTTKAFRHSQA